MSAFREILTTDRAVPLGDKSDRESETLVGDVDGAGLPILRAIEVEVAAEVPSCPPPDSVHEPVERLLKRPTLRPPKGSNNLVDRRPGFPLRSISVTCQQALGGREVLIG
jgi:hypothetical protein